MSGTMRSTPYPSSLPGLTRQSIYKKHFDLFGWMRGSSPRMTTERLAKTDA
jgi:hypothetical protein